MPTVFETGPYLAVAVLCENTLHEKDGVLSIMRVVDTITHRAAGPEPPDQMPPIMVPLKMVISLKAGEARARMTVVVQMEDPTGLKREAGKSAITFNGGGNSGVNLDVALSVGLEHEGLYWFDVLLDDHLLTRIPLRVLYEPHQTR